MSMNITVTARRSPVKTSSPCSRRRCREGGIDVGAKCGVEVPLLDQPGLHAVERGGQHRGRRPKRPAGVTLVARRDTFSPFARS